ncbi:MerR family transcriptional regulator [Candidatus Chromulinivorax destructor]|uniref:MerR family transcriptional regulator n=1 Tax=Candidatus Chromulinivorax destructor TaxID=2066483 RepID=A0A345ZAF9_9BACT|nr:MerR family transcriptional regulator [Candidatus Chromulinivorax destructor]AXK60276.1 MerR family transcriptional regulator [Candidatus Chromulinivorax destructor]
MLNNKIKKKQAFFSISAVAKMFSVHQQTIRLYEKEGFITPKRSDGNTRMFSEEDVDRLEEIIHLTHQMGINLAGVEMILKLQKKITRMQKDMNKIFTNAQSELIQETDARKSLIQAQTKQLLKIKNHPDAEIVHDVTTHEKSKKDNFNDWDIDYEE